jgi:hypothetical protein
MKWLIGVFLLFNVAFAGPACAQFYKYVDQKGHLRFTDDINQVPENQRNKAASYAVAQPDDSDTGESEGGAEKKPAARDSAPEASSETALAASLEEEPLDIAKVRLEELKKQIDADYRALSKEKEGLAKDKDAAKTREQVIGYNKRVEAFNQRAGEYEARSNELRQQVEIYNGRVFEQNTKWTPSAKK